MAKLFRFLDFYWPRFVAYVVCVSAFALLVFVLNGPSVFNRDILYGAIGWVLIYAFFDITRTSRDFRRSEVERFVLPAEHNLSSLSVSPSSALSRPRSQSSE